jgi:hypothetical protein
VICPTGKSPINSRILLSSPSCKKILLFDPVETAIEQLGPVLTRGAFRDRHERGMRDAMDAGIVCESGSLGLDDVQQAWMQFEM